MSDKSNAQSRCARLAAQVQPPPNTAISVEDLMAAYAPETLSAMAQSSHHYNTLTIEIVKELSAVLPNPSEQLILDKSFLSQLQQQPELDIFASELVSHAVSSRHTIDRSHFDPVCSLCVIYPSDKFQIAAILTICNKHVIAVSPCGTRTGLEGGSLSIIPGVTIDMSRMDKVLQLLPDELLVQVEPGIEKLTLQKYLKSKGYFFPVDPGSNACIGGYINTNASGTLLGGSMTTAVRSLEVVTATGKIMTTRARSVKSSAGYNLQGLIIGSEGSLVIVTSAYLTIKPLPRHILSARVQFETTFQVTQYVLSLRALGMTQLARTELLNAQSIDSINKYAKTTFDVRPTLLVELHAQTQNELTSLETEIAQVAKKHNSLHFHAASTPEEYNTIWSTRNNALFAAFTLFTKSPAATAAAAAAAAATAAAPTSPLPKPRIQVFVTDICVPLPQLPQIIEQTERDFAACGLPCPIAGHVGDGNFHCFIPYDTNDKTQVDAIAQTNAKMLRRAIACNGTITGEHGVGMGKMPFLPEERGVVAMDWMRSIKRALDPNYILNPYKVFTPTLCEYSNEAQQHHHHHHHQQQQ